MSLGPDPNAILGKFLDRQKRQEQFSEDMRRVMYNGPGGAPVAGGGTVAPTRGGAAGRVRSPGLAAGAALALGGAATTAAECHSEARDQCRQAVERSRRQTCPFDDHSAFGACAADRAAPVRVPVLEQEDVTAATNAARNLGKYNRDIGQKIGAGAPFDAPFADMFASGASAPAGRSGGGRRGGAPPAMPPAMPATLADSSAEVRAAAVANRTRMRGSQDLLGGYVLPGQEEQEKQNRRNVNLPPRPTLNVGRDLLPQAMMKLQYDGGSVKGLTCARSEYLNSKILFEANRDRNMAGVMLG